MTQLDGFLGARLDGFLGARMEAEKRPLLVDALADARRIHVGRRGRS